MKTIYVTVGTTRFDSLISEITSNKILKVLKEKGCKRLILQIGNGNKLENTAIEAIGRSHEIEVDQYRFKFEPTRSDILNSDLIIGHAGSGTCMDILEGNRPALLVTNDELMDKHQTELAEELCNEGYVYFCAVPELATCLETLNFGTLKTRKVDVENMNVFVDNLNKLITS